jgi:hypothetical protein
MVRRKGSRGSKPENRLAAREFRERWKAFSRGGSIGSLLLIDLSDSTAFKTKHPEAVWLPRLQHFYAAVSRRLPRGIKRKYLGDGILVYLPKEVVPPRKVPGLAKGILEMVAKEGAKRSYVEEYSLRCRVVLDFGTVFLLDGADPQGTPVDRLFRAEKFVPAGAVGFSAAFRQAAGIANAFPIGKHLLRGVAKDRQELFLLQEPQGDARQQVEEEREHSALEDLWGLGPDPAEPVHVIGGRILLSDQQPYSVHSGDKDAAVIVARCLARIGRIEECHFQTCAEFSEESYRSNVICIGGPDFNSVTERFMAECRLRFGFVWRGLTCRLQDRTTGSWWGVRREQGRVTRDAGFFAKCTNPFDERREVILLCGIETYGVLGAAQLLTGRANNPRFFDLYERILAMNVRRRQGGAPRNFSVVSEFGVEITGAVRNEPLTRQLEGVRVHNIARVKRRRR